MVQVPEFSPTWLTFDAEKERWLIGITEAGNRNRERPWQVVVDARAGEGVEVVDLPDPTPIPSFGF